MTSLWTRGTTSRGWPRMPGLLMSITVFCVSMTPGCGLVRPRGQNERGRTGRLLASVDSFDVVYEVALAAVGQRAIVTRADDFTGTIHAEAPANSLITRRSRRE